MLVHFNPRFQPITSTQVQRAAPLVQKARPFLDSLEIRSGDTGSWLDCFKNCFKAIWGFILGLFSKKTANQKDVGVENTGGRSEVAQHIEIEDTEEIRREIAQLNAQGISVPTPESNPEWFRKFFKDDSDYTGMSQLDAVDARLAQNWCAFPKLAVYLRDAHPDIGLYAACKRINQAFDKDPTRNFLTPRHVITHEIPIQQPVLQLVDEILEPPKPQMCGDNNLYKDFKKNDINYADLSPQDMERFSKTRMDCEFPGLALCLVKESGVDSMAEAVRRINEAHKKFPEMDAMSPFFVLTNSDATPVPEGSDGVHPRAVPVPKPVNGAVYFHREYTKLDLNFAEMSEEEQQEIQAVAHDCSYPKLAMYLSKAFDLGLAEAAKRINAVENRYPDRNAMTAEFVMQWY